DLAGTQVHANHVAPRRGLAGNAKGPEERPHEHTIGRAFIAVEPLLARLLVLALRRNLITRYKPRGEGEISRHAEHDLPLRIDRDAGPVEDAEISRIDDRAF